MQTFSPTDDGSLQTSLLRNKNATYGPPADRLSESEVRRVQRRKGRRAFNQKSRENLHTVSRKEFVLE